MKILIIANGIPTTDYPLSGIFEYDQARALAALGVDVEYFSIDLRSFLRLRPYGIFHGEKDGIKWHTISLPVGALPINIFCFIGKVTLQYLFNKVFRTSKRPDIIHAHFTDMGNIATSVSKRYGIPLVMTEHSSAINEKVIPSSLLKCAKFAYTHSDKVIAVSTPLANKISKISGIKPVTIPNIIDCSVFACVKKELHEGFRIVSTAGLVERKRTRLILEALFELKSEFNDLYLDIIGDGPLRQELQDYVSKKDIIDKVHFWGTLKRCDMSSVYSKSDCFILTSEVETFGVVYVEAMAAGLPVIATRCGGPEDFVNKRNGILIDVDNLEQLKTAIKFMYRTHREYNSNSIRMFADNYAPTTIGSKLICLYQKILNKND